MSGLSTNASAGRRMERARAFQVIYSLFFSKAESNRALASLYANSVYADPTRVDAVEDIEEPCDLELFDAEAAGAWSGPEGEMDEGLPPLSFSRDDHSEDIVITPRVTSGQPEGFGWELVLGVWQKRDELDKTISSYSQNWRLDRMGKVELALLRLAIYELLYRDDVPTRVVINEAIELSKKFGDDSSRNFVNGILDAIVKSVDSGEIKRQSLFWGQQEGV